MNHILLVDDEPVNHLLIRQILEQAKLTICSAANGEEALSLLEKSNFRLMITDLHMPGFNGLELSRKAMAIAPDMPVILISGALTPDISWLAAEVGIAKVLAKPFRPDEILGAVLAVVGNVRKEH